MNRDELFIRVKAMPPRITTHEGTESLYPREPGGGTWIACNRSGMLLALLNWNITGGDSGQAKVKSRGRVIPQLIGAADLFSTEARVASLPLHGTLPFRLVEIFRKEQFIREWRWDGAQLSRFQFPWRRQHWFSSSVSDTAAEFERRKICDAAAIENNTEGLEWLRAVHREHGARCGSFSICMHRQDAATVSYTEVRCAGDFVGMNYRAGSPCVARPISAMSSVGASREDWACHCQFPPTTSASEVS